MAGTVPIIQARSITKVVGLSSRPVFFINLNNAPNPSLVVKGESKAGAAIMGDADRELSVSWSSKLMKNVNNNQVNTKIMDVQEIGRFTRFAQTVYPGNSPQSAFLAGNYLWVKMPFVQGLTDAELFDESRNAFTVKNVKDAVKQFLRPQVWRDLGKIVAVDIFNGNNDRFAVDSVGPNQPVTVQWANQGNMMFLPAGAASAMIGLDTFDPSGVHDGRSNLVVGAGSSVILDILKTDAAKRDFAHKCTDAIGRELQNRLPSNSIAIEIMGPQGGHILRIQKTAIKDTLRPFSVPFLEGLNAGIMDLRGYLTGKRQQYAAQAAGVGPAKNVPQGILNRIAYLGW